MTTDKDSLIDEAAARQLVGRCGCARLVAIVGRSWDEIAAQVNLDDLTDTELEILAASLGLPMPVVFVKQSGDAD